MNMTLRLTAFLFLLMLFACTDDTATSQPESITTERSADDPLSKISEAIEQDPTNQALRFERAKMLYEREGYEGSIADLKVAMESDSTKPEYLHLLADNYMDYFQSRKALATMEHAAYLHPTRIPTILKLAEFELILERHQEALGTLSKIRVVDPNHPEMFYMVGMVLRDMGEEDGAINAFQSCVEQDAQNVDAWIALGTLTAERNPGVAEQYFKNAINLAPNNAITRHKMATFLTNQKRFDAALEQYDEIIKFDQQYVDAFYNSGILLLEKNEIEKAYQQFDLATKANPAFAKAYYYRGVAAFNQGKVDQARQDFEQSLNIDPTLEMAQKALENTL